LELDVDLSAGIHFCVATRTDSEREQGPPKFPHAFSNQSTMSAEGYVKGMLMRALDQSSIVSRCDLQRNSVCWLSPEVEPDLISPTA